MLKGKSILELQVLFLWLFLYNQKRDFRNKKKRSLFSNTKKLSGWNASVTFSLSALNWLRLPSCSCSTSKQSIIYRCFLFSNSFPLQSANVAWSIQRKWRSKIIGGRILSVASPPVFLLFLASMSPLSLFSEEKLRGRWAKVEKILVKGFCQQCFPSLHLCHRFLLLQSKESAPTNWIFVRKQREARGGVKKREMDGVTSRQSRGQRWKEGVHSWMDGWVLETEQKRNVSMWNQL